MAYLLLCVLLANDCCRHLACSASLQCMTTLVIIRWQGISGTNKIPAHVIPCFFFLNMLSRKWTISAFSLIVATQYVMSWVCQLEANIWGWLVNLFISLILSCTCCIIHYTKIVMTQMCMEVSVML